MYPRIALEPCEELLFNAPALFGVRTGGHLFVTNYRVIALLYRSSLPFRYGNTRSIRLSAITGVKSESKRIGWPLPKQSVHVTFDGGELTLRPLALPRFMGMISGREFVAGILAALESAGVPGLASTDDGRPRS